jgi:hypothetical protein
MVAVSETKESGREPGGTTNRKEMEGFLAGN